MSNKYVAMLIPVSKIYRFSSSPDYIGWCNFGYLVSLSGAYRLDKFALRLMAFQSILNHHNKEIPDSSKAFIEYSLGKSELNGLNGFNEQLNEICDDIELLSVPAFYKIVAGLGFWLMLASLSVLFFCWWLVFILPPAIYFISVWAKNMHQLNYMANLAILSRRSEPFEKFCKMKGLIADFPEDLSAFKIIGNAFGGDEKFRLGSDDWDKEFEFSILDKVQDQELRLTKISNLMAINALMRNSQN